MRSWRFTGQEFQILWNAYDRDRLPYPLAFRPATAVDWADLVRLREEAVRSLLDRYSPDLDETLGVLLNPDVRVESKGFGGSAVFRFHGVIRGGYGATLTQLPGVAEDTGGDVLLARCRADEVAGAAVTALPQARPGRQAAISFRRGELAEDRQRYVRRADEYSIAERLNRVFKRERSALGEVAVFPSGAVDSRPTTDGGGFLWADYVDDGRYYIKSGDPIVARPMDARMMATEIARLVESVGRGHGTADHTATGPRVIR
ncbi:ESX secretion-associated protein EspG [Nocardia panacis]|uniref:ESX secretion-associated protein EspG n=1 Tax=Nocardia panacis TaxID=2340916 RepID=A0A3A4KT69_9NOCA|nr:ESX secretion-associated protein EspG [Nocardia panacis]RJO72953.1 ESX secretion-associated protein EspG [Nocardia panacis]